MGNARQRGEKESKEPENIRADKSVEEVVSQHIEQWAAVIRLKRTDARFEQFREDITGALRACIEAHVAEQIPLFKKFTRIADMRMHLKKEAKEARDLAQWLRDFNGRYVIGQPTMVLCPGPDFPGRVFDLSAPAQDLDMLASLLEDRAAACKDTGGPTPKMLAFEALAEGLIRAYRRATKRKGTGGNVREGTSLLYKLVQAVLPTASELAKARTGRPLKTPTSGRLGDKLSELAERLDKLPSDFERGAQPPKN